MRAAGYFQCGGGQAVEVLALIPAARQARQQRLREVQALHVAQGFEAREVRAQPLVQLLGQGLLVEGRPLFFFRSGLDGGKVLPHKLQPLLQLPGSGRPVQLADAGFLQIGQQRPRHQRRLGLANHRFGEQQGAQAAHAAPRHALRGGVVAHFVGGRNLVGKGQFQLVLPKRGSQRRARRRGGTRQVRHRKKRRLRVHIRGVQAYALARYQAQPVGGFALGQPVGVSQGREQANR